MLSSLINTRVPRLISPEPAVARESMASFAALPDRLIRLDPRLLRDQSGDRAKLESARSFDRLEYQPRSILITRRSNRLVSRP